jgi:hypothetical protein
VRRRLDVGCQATLDTHSLCEISLSFTTASACAPCDKRGVNMGANVGVTLASACTGRSWIPDANDLVVVARGEKTDRSRVGDAAYDLVAGLHAFCWSPFLLFFFSSFAQAKGQEGQEKVP